MEYSEDWRGIKPHLYRIARNHRSMKNIVYLANRLQKTMTPNHTPSNANI